jgi:hypothetical protein
MSMVLGAAGLFGILAAPAAQPILHYSFDAGTTTGASGTTVADLGIGGNNGTITGGALAVVPGVFDEAVEFQMNVNASGRYINVGVPLLSTTDSSQPYTIAAWIQTTAGGGILTQYDSTSQRFGVENRASGDGKPQWWTNSITRAMANSATMDGQWYHVAFVKDVSQAITIYVNGINDTDPAVGTKSHPQVFANANTLIGTYNGSILNFVGKMDEVQVFDQALSATQIKGLLWNNSAASQHPALRLDFGGDYTGVDGPQVVQDGWREMSNSATVRGNVTEVFNYGAHMVTVAVEGQQVSGDQAPSWQNRAPASQGAYRIDHPVGDVANDFVFTGAGGTTSVTLSDLPAGTHYVRTYHHDSRTDYGTVNVHVSDANDTDRLVAYRQEITTGGRKTTSPASGNSAPGIIGTVPFVVVSDGSGNVVVKVTTGDSYTHLSGLEITDSLPAGLKVDFGLTGSNTQVGFQPFGHSSDSHSLPQSHWFFSDAGNYGSVEVGYRTSTAGISPRDRGAMSSPGGLSDLARDFRAASNDLLLDLGQLRKGTYSITTYHHDRDNQWGSIGVGVSDADGTRLNVVPGLTHTTGPNADPASGTFQVRSNGLAPVRVALTGGTLILNGFEVERIDAPPGPPEPLKIFLVAGQSNGDGRGNPADLLADLQSPQGVPIFHNGRWHGLQPGLTDANHPGLFGPEITFGRDVAEALAGENVALVKYAWGGTNLAIDWNPDTPGAHYSAFLNAVQQALGNVGPDYLPEIAGMIWMQGESDTGILERAENYEANLTNFIQSVRTDLDAPDMPFVIGQILDYPTYTYSDLVRAAQENVAAADRMVALVRTDDLPVIPNNANHYNAAGQMELGSRFATAVLTVPEPTSAGMLLSIGLAAALLAGRGSRRHGRE